MTFRFQHDPRVIVNPCNIRDFCSLAINNNEIFYGFDCLPTGEADEKNGREDS